MSENFIGLGPNPNENQPDIPLGLGMQLSQNPEALEAFGRLSDDEKTSMIKHIQAATTGEDAKERIAEAIQKLSPQQ